MSEVAGAPAAPVAPAPAAPVAPAPAASAPQAAQNPAETAPAAKVDDKTTPTPDQAEKRGQSRFDRKIDRLHRRAAEAEARATFLEKQLSEYKPKAPDEAGAPKLENFKDIEEYAAAREKYAADRALKEHTAKQQSETQKQAQARLTEGWESKVERASGKYEDFDDVVGDLQPTTPWAMAIMEAENSEDIAYHLGKNLDEARRIAALPPASQIREIGKLEAKFLAEPPKAKTPSKAPPPIEPLKGTTTATSPDMSDTKDIGKWMKLRQKQVHGGRR